MSFPELSTLIITMESGFFVVETKFHVIDLFSFLRKKVLRGALTNGPSFSSSSTTEPPTNLTCLNWIFHFVSLIAVERSVGYGLI